MGDSVYVGFPGLNLHFDLNRIAFSILGKDVYWYGIIIAVGMLLALLYGFKNAKRFNVSSDDLVDTVFFSVILAVIGARLYYVLFSAPISQNTFFSNPISIIQVWDGGLAIYGGIIFAFVTALCVCRYKKISVGAMFDIASLGFLIGQAVGRWGNFVNAEAYGAPTNLPWRMQVYNPDGLLVTAQPCFLYESIWCVLGLILLHIYSKRRKFNGEVFLMYVMWYSFGRFFIESLRTDSLWIGTASHPDGIKVSMLVAAVLFLVALTLIIIKRSQIKREGTDYKPMYAEIGSTLAEEDLESVDDDTDEGNDEDYEEEDDEKSPESENPEPENEEENNDETDNEAKEPEDK